VYSFQHRSARRDKTMLARVIIFNDEWTQNPVIVYTLYAHLMNMIAIFKESYQLYLSRERTRQKVV